MILAHQLWPSPFPPSSAWVTGLPLADGLSLQPHPGLPLHEVDHCLVQIAKMVVAAVVGLHLDAVVVTAVLMSTYAHGSAPCCKPTCKPPSEHEP